MKNMNKTKTYEYTTQALKCVTLKGGGARGGRKLKKLKAVNNFQRKAPE